MGNSLELPDRKMPGIGPRTQQSGAQHFQAQRQVILPFRPTNTLPNDVEDTNPTRTTHNSDALVVETSMFDLSHRTASTGGETPADIGSLPHFERRTSGPTSLYSGYSSATSGARRRRYIKRYQNEEEKLLDMLHEKERLLKTAIQQGQQLRAKCNRYREELNTLKQPENDNLPESQWKKKYTDLERKYRDLKESTEVLEARLNNGRDMLIQSNETIEVLTDELNKQRLAGQSKLSTSMPNLATITVKDPKGRKTITQLITDNSLLQQEVRQLTARNRNGREFLRSVEQEKREQQSKIVELQDRLKNLQAENLRLRHGDQSIRDSSAGIPLYAKVNKRPDPSIIEEEEQYIIEEILEDDDDFPHTDQEYAQNPGTPERKSMGFDIDVESPRFSDSGMPSPLGNSTNMYEEVVVSNGMLTESGTSVRGQFMDYSPYRHGNEDDPNTGEFYINNDDVTTRF